MVPHARFSAALASVTTLALAGALGRLAGQTALEPVNALGSHVSSPRRRHQRHFSLRWTVPGILINFGGCLFWASVVERWARDDPPEHACDALLRGSVAATLAYVTDYHGLPRALRPRYERKLPKPMLLAVYASLAVALPLRAWVSAVRRR
jgi:hypothetical protein